MKKILSILIAMMLSVSLMACGKAADSQTQTKEEDNLLSGKHHVTITVQDYGDINVELDAATEIQPLIGSKEGILHTTLAFVNPGDGVLIPNPGYPTYTSVIHLAMEQVARIIR